MAMTPKTETVLVVLGIRLVRSNPMPATVVQWKGSRDPVYMHLTQAQHEAMGEDQTALWEATFLDGHYWLERRLPDPPRDVIEKKFGKVILSETEIPF